MSETDPFDRLETAAEKVARIAEDATLRNRYETGNRRGLLWIHALIGLFAGPQMLLWGSAPTIETALGIWSRSMMAALGFIGGACLAWGLTRRPRSIPFEVAGLSLVGIWDLLMTLGLMYARWRQDDYTVINLGDQLPAGYVSAYPVTVYAGLFALISIHLWTLRQLKLGGLKGGDR